MKILLLALTIISAQAFGQHKDDRIIIIKVADSASAREAIRVALVKNNFVVKDIGSKDTLVTYPMEMTTMPGYAMLLAIVKGDKIELRGNYSTKKMNSFGFSTPDKDVIPIRYYGSSKSWRILAKVAEDVTGVAALNFAK